PGRAHAASSSRASTPLPHPGRSRGPRHTRTPSCRWLSVSQSAVTVRAFDKALPCEHTVIADAYTRRSKSLPEILTRPLSVPVLASPMFIASGKELVKAQCQSGIVGSFPALNARPAEELADWFDEINEENAAFAAANPDQPVGPLAANLIVHRTNDRLEHDLGRSE